MDIEFNRRITQIIRALYYSATNEWAEIAKEHGMSSAQQYLLYVLNSREENLTITEIGRLGCWHISTVTRLLKPLKDNGYVSITNGKGRTKVVRLTELGMLKLKEINETVAPRSNFPLNCTGIDDESLEMFARIGLQILQNQKGTEFTQWIETSEAEFIGFPMDA